MIQLFQYNPATILSAIYKKDHSSSKVMDGKQT